MLTALIAVAGTLLGSIVASYFQRAIADRAVLHSFADRLRQDRLNAYNAFAAAAIDYRLAQMDWWHLVRREPEVDHSTRPEVYAKRAALAAALLRVELLGEDVQLHRLGSAVLVVTRNIRDAPTSEDFNRVTDEASAAINAFVRHAAAEVQRPPTARALRSSRRPRPVNPPAAGGSSRPGP